MNDFGSDPNQFIHELKVHLLPALKMYGFAIKMEHFTIAQKVTQSFP